MIPIDFSTPIQSLPHQEAFWKVVIAGLCALVFIPGLCAAVVIMVIMP